MWTQWTSETAPIFIILSGKTMYTSGKKRTSFFGENKGQSKRWKPVNRILKSRIQPLMESGIHRHGIRNPQRGIRNPRLSWITLHGASYDSVVELFWRQLECPLPWRERMCLWFMPSRWERLSWGLKKAHFCKIYDTAKLLGVKMLRFITTVR